jgi:hypothetical protein
MVIIGGLVAIALLALIGLFLVVRSGPRSAKPVAPQTPNVPATAPAAPSSGLNGSTPLASSDDWTLALANPELRARLRGQLRELNYELHYLHQRSREIEQRADLLAGIIARAQELTSDTAARMQPLDSVPQRARYAQSN